MSENASPKTQQTQPRGVGCTALVRLFADDECNALMTALQNTARDWHSETECPDIKESVYRYLEAQPRTTMVAELVQHLHRLGYRIEPNIKDQAQPDNQNQP